MFKPTELYKPAFQLGDRTPLSPELLDMQKRLRDQVNFIREKTAQMKESVIRAAVGPDTPLGPELARRMRWEFHPGGIEKVFQDDRLLVVFQPGHLDLETGEWKVPYTTVGGQG